jgi:peptide-methionine (S)-S-oxide reductase
MMLRIIVFALALSVATTSAGAAGRAVILPAPLYDPAPERSGEKRLVLAGGCFWGVQGVFQHVKGVTRVLAGYAGGEKETAHYQRVGRGDTGHAEAVEIVYDPASVSLGELLRVYFSVVHDPTQLNRQGPDTGTQYRSAIFVSEPVQAKVAREYIAQLSAAKIFEGRIVTKLEKFTGFYPAEAYHQDYLAHHPDEPYVAFNDLPKVEALRLLYPALWRDPPALTGAGAKSPAM